jgi:DMSO/TMAO reductase YedYZ heme-binding membrane subunit
MPKSSGLLEGWPIVGMSASVVALEVALTFALSGTAETGIRASIRTTATSSLFFFLAAFVASSLCVLAPSRATKWLLRNRRQIGVSFAVSQLTHLALIGVLAMRYGESFWRRVAMTTIAGGGAGYLFTAAMTITSFDRPTAWLGRSRWRRLHQFGMYVLFGIFTFSYALLARRSPHYTAFTVLLALALVLRMAARRRR